MDTPTTSGCAADDGRRSSSSTPNTAKRAATSSGLDLRNSAVARLLIEGTYPNYHPPSKKPPESPSRFAYGGIKIKTEKVDHDERSDASPAHSHTPVHASETYRADVQSFGVSSNNPDSNSESQNGVTSTASPSQATNQNSATDSGSVAREAEQSVWQCRYCSFTTGERGAMYSHIKMHLNMNQAMKKPRPATQITQSALYNYLADRADTHSNNNSDRHGSQSPANSASSRSSSAAEPTISSQPQNSASNYLKSIVRTILKRKTNSDDGDDDVDENNQPKDLTHGHKVEGPAREPGLYYSVSSGGYNMPLSRVNRKTPIKRKRASEDSDECWTATLDANEAAKLRDSMAKTGTSGVSPYSTRSRHQTSGQYQQPQMSDYVTDDSQDEDNEVTHAGVTSGVMVIKQEPEEYTQVDVGSSADENIEIGHQYEKAVPPATVYPTQLFHKDFASSSAPHVAALLQMDKLSSLPCKKTPLMTTEELRNELKKCDKSIQCTLLTDASPATKGHDPGDSNQSEPVCSQSGDSTTVLRCENCGITFDDEVLHSIHMGCHSHVDVFMCNVCGRSCGNKYTFYTHIMRGHQHL